MGGGASLIEGVEDLLTTTLIIGRAISAMTFPGMFRIYDFHSKRAPKLKNAANFTFFGPDDDEEDDDEGEDSPVPDPSAYEHFFKVTVNGDDVYLEDPLAANESGWTPLHTCCMSLSTVQAGLDIIDETLRRGGNFETYTVFGPGTFNKGWTPLLMASAYGIDPLVEKLVECGANVNAVNSFGASCLLEACHRGFADIAKSLLKGHPDLSYIPTDEDAAKSPFSSGPPQSALGEASRCGFFKIVQALLDAGAPKDLPNSIGWTPLHEACFYHRIETVKTLLLAGCDPTKRTRRGALPYHLAGLGEIRTMLESMGGEGAVPAENDTIDMLQVLTDLAGAESVYDSQGEEIPAKGRQCSGPTPSLLFVTDGSHQLPLIVFDREDDDDADVDEDGKEDHSDEAMHKKKIHSHRDEKHSGEKDSDDSSLPLLHSGGVLGDLPALSPAKASPEKHQLHNDVHAALRMDDKSSISNNKPTSINRRADGKQKTKKSANDDDFATDMPKEFLCQLTQKPMSDPVKTVYGNIYDRTAIMNWFSTQGRICPLTGYPLAETDLSPLPKLAEQIRQWILKKSLQSHEVDSGKTPQKTSNSTENDDLYDF